jgi:hypothetical protein
LGVFGVLDLSLLCRQGRLWRLDIPWAPWFLGFGRLGRLLVRLWSWSWASLILVLGVFGVWFFGVLGVFALGRPWSGIYGLGLFGVLDVFGVLGVFRLGSLCLGRLGCPWHLGRRLRSCASWASQSSLVLCLGRLGRIWVFGVFGVLGGVSLFGLWRHGRLLFLDVLGHVLLGRLLTYFVGLGVLVGVFGLGLGCHWSWASLFRSWVSWGLSASFASWVLGVLGGVFCLGPLGSLVLGMVGVFGLRRFCSSAPLAAPWMSIASWVSLVLVLEVFLCLESWASMASWAVLGVLSVFGPGSLESWALLCPSIATRVLECRVKGFSGLVKSRGLRHD